MEPNRFNTYFTRSNSAASKIKAKLTFTAVVGSAVDPEDTEDITPLVDTVVMGNSKEAPAALVTQILANIDKGKQLCGSAINPDTIEDYLSRSRRIILVALHNNEIEAFAVIGNTRYHMDIGLICNAKNSRLKRAAAALLKIIGKFAKAIDQDTLYLEALQSRVSYYEQFGFRQSGMEDAGLIPMSVETEEFLEGTNAATGGRRTLKNRKRRRAATRKN